MYDFTRVTRLSIRFKATINLKAIIGFIDYAIGCI